MNLKDAEELYLRCDCGSEIITFDHDEEFNLIYVAIYNQYYDNKHSLWTRIRRAWSILWTGQEYSDQVVLKHTDMLKLSEFISKLNEKPKTTTDEAVCHTV